MKFTREFKEDYFFPAVSFLNQLIIFWIRFGTNGKEYELCSIPSDSKVEADKFIYKLAVEIKATVCYNINNKIIIYDKKNRIYMTFKNNVVNQNNILINVILSK